jgi:hypothetical protein
MWPGSTLGAACSQEPVSRADPWERSAEYGAITLDRLPQRQFGSPDLYTSIATVRQKLTSDASRGTIGNRLNHRDVNTSCNTHCEHCTPTAKAFFGSRIFPTLKMETSSSETSVHTRLTRRHILEDVIHIITSVQVLQRFSKQGPRNTESISSSSILSLRLPCGKCTVAVEAECGGWTDFQ